MTKHEDEVTTMKVNELKDSLIGVDMLSKKGNVYTARRGYFYGRCESGESYGGPHCQDKNHQSLS